MHTKYVIPPPPAGTPPTLGGECHPDAWTVRCAKKYIITFYKVKIANRSNAVDENKSSPSTNNTKENSAKPILQHSRE